MADCGCVGDKLCLAHKLRYWRDGGLQISPAATPTRRNNLPTRARSLNSWERGVATDSRGMPILRPEDMQPMPIKEYASRRAEMDAAREKLKHPTPPSQKAADK